MLRIAPTTVLTGSFRKLTITVGNMGEMVGGSWTFISIFGAVLFLWILLNFLLLIKLGSSFNPYP